MFLEGLNCFYGVVSSPFNYVSPDPLTTYCHNIKIGPNRIMSKEVVNYFFLRVGTQITILVNSHYLIFICYENVVEVEGRLITLFLDIRNFSSWG